MKIHFGTRLYTGFILAILLCAVSGFTSYFISQKQQTQRIWVKKSRKIFDSTGRVERLLVDMETGRRGFRATNQKRFLEPYYKGRQQITLTITELRNLLSDNPELGKRELVLEQHVDSLLTFWQQNGDDADEYTREYITMLTDEEKVKMDEIRSIITALQKEETKLLNERREEHDQLIYYGTLSSGIDSILSLIIILILVFVVIREFKSRKKVQEQLRSSVKQLEEHAQVLRASEMELKKAMDALGKINKQQEKFVYTVAHDIKSPLNGIKGALSVMQEDDDIINNEFLSELTQITSTAAAHLSNMVDNLLEYSKISLNNQTIELVDVNELLEQMALLLFPPKNIEIKIAENMPVFTTRKLIIQQVFQNLMSNAIKYNSKEKGLIEIGYNDKGDFYEFYVKDNGQGIPGNDKEKIFDLMKTTDNKSTTDSSTGFGLNIVKLIIEEQGGKIWYDSVVGQGATFYFLWKK